MLPIADVDRSLQAREVAKKMLQFHLKHNQNRMKQLANKHKTNREFQIGDLVYLSLQAYKQQIVRRILNQKLALKYFGPFPIVDKVGQVSYRLQLPPGSRIHSTFYVSQLKKYVGATPTQAQLPLVDAHGALLKDLVRILETRMVKKGN